MALRAPKVTLQDIDARRKQFLWAGTLRITGAKCKVNWTRAARSKKNGGLGILHLGKFARALCLRWLWRDWNPEDKPWAGSEFPCNETDSTYLRQQPPSKLGMGRK